MTNKKPAESVSSQTGYARDSANYSPIRSYTKAAIFTLATYGVIPRSFASWIIQRGGLRHD